MRLRAAVAGGGFVVDGVAGGAVHVGVAVGEVEEASGDLDGEGIGCVEGEEPDAGVARVVVDVGADVEFLKFGEPGEGGEEARPDAGHEEGDDAEVGFVLEGIDGEAGGEEGLEGVDGEFPVEEEEVVPALIHRGFGLRVGEAGGEALLEGGASRHRPECGST